MKKRILIGITVVIQLTAISITLLNYLFFTNTLANNKNWQVTKNQLFRPGQDGVDFENKLPALAKNALNLSAWRGWHEVSLKEPILWKELSFKFLPSKNSYFYAIFHKTEDGFSAVRISYSPLYRSALISAKYTGEFIEHIPLSIEELNGSGWQELTLKKSNSTNHAIEVWYNNKYIVNYSPITQVSGNIAFRTGREEILIDELKVMGENNQILLNEKFDRLNQFWSYFIELIFITLFTDFILWVFINKNEKNVLSIFQFNFVLCLALILANIILLPFNKMLRSQYYYGNSFGDLIRERLKINKTMPNGKEAAWLKKADEKLFFTYPIKNVNKKRIMFIGSSQTSGEGISFEGEDFVSQFDKLINQSSSSSEPKFEIINIGRDGQITKDLFVHFQNQWLKLKPDVVIINLSSNDEEYENGINFEYYLEEFIRMSEKYDFKLIFIAEAVSVEYKHTLQNHQIMQKTAEKNNITFINMHQYLAEHQEEGIIWWDFVHPTSFGYKLIANHLFKSLKTELNY